MRASATLSKLAYRHSVAMARKQRLWHNAPAAGGHL
jgi:uncharacterized protein YkwD